ncbi:hypothetical protein TruAng_009848 [Truncatella angustata]|nr:hypothetical protein TruAng_009848 [Truncatella angustata]
MKVSLSAIVLACGLQVAIGAAVEERGLNCSARRQIATFDDVPALPISTVDLGWTSGFSPYLDLNYTRFAVAAQGTTIGNNALYYTMSRLAPGAWDSWWPALADLIGRNGSLPLLAYPPSIIGAAPQTYFKLNAFQFGCGVRQSVANFLPFDCRIIVRPITPSLNNHYYICDFVPNGNATLQTCRPNTLPVGNGYTFQTVGRVGENSWFSSRSDLFNPQVVNTLFTTIDNVDYTEYCVPSVQ